MTMSPKFKGMVNQGTLWFARIIVGLSSVAIVGLTTFAVSVFNETRSDVKILLQYHVELKSRLDSHDGKLEFLEGRIESAFKQVADLESDLFEKKIKR